MGLGPPFFATSLVLSSPLAIPLTKSKGKKLRRGVNVLGSRILHLFLDDQTMVIQMKRGEEWRNRSLISVSDDNGIEHSDYLCRGSIIAR